MATTNEIETLLEKTVVLLHSSNDNSAAEMRLLLDEEIKKHYGPEKTLTNKMTKKQLADEVNFPGKAVTQSPQPLEAEKVKNLVNSPTKAISVSPETIIPDLDDSVSALGGGLLSTTVEDKENRKKSDDLKCCVCEKMMFTDTNRLIECSKCGAPYHQDCHKPQITDKEASEEERRHNWQCHNCSTKPTTSKSSSNVARAAAGILVIPNKPKTLAATCVASIKSRSSATSSRSSSPSKSSTSIYKTVQSATKSSTIASSKTAKNERSSLAKTSSSTMNEVKSSSTTSSEKKHSSKSSSSRSKSKPSSKHRGRKRKSSKYK